MHDHNAMLEQIAKIKRMASEFSHMPSYGPSNSMAHSGVYLLAEMVEQLAQNQAELDSRLRASHDIHGDAHIDEAV
jgi:hypothetical protein